LWPDDYPEAAGMDPYFICTMCRWFQKVSTHAATVTCPQCGSTAERRTCYPEFSYRVLSVDTAYGEKQENSWSAATCWGIWHDKEDAPRAMLIEAWRGRPRLRGVPDSKNPAERMGLVERIYKIATERQVDTVLIEHKSRGQDLYQELEKQMMEWPFQLTYFEPAGSKEVRLEACVPLFVNERVWAPDKQWAETVIAETVSAPKGQFTDLADCVSMTLLYLRRNGFLSMADEYRRDTRRAMVFTNSVNRQTLGDLYEGW
jgi:phage terminase large subunit-like protein